MLDNPHLYIDAFSDAGSDLITIHIEPEYDHLATIEHIKSLGKQVGIALNPATSVDKINHVLNKAELDLVLCMTVNPGFGGQTFIHDVLKKVEELKILREKDQKHFVIEVDGGVCPEHVKPCLEAGVDIFVAGTAYFKGNLNERSEFAKSVGE